MPNSRGKPSKAGGRHDVLEPVVEEREEALDKEEFPEKAEAAVGEEDADKEEAREVHAPPIPPTPSQREVEAHRLTHRPFRS